MIRFLIDENLRGQFWFAIQAHSDRDGALLDVKRLLDIDAERRVLYNKTGRTFLLGARLTY